MSAKEAISVVNLIRDKTKVDKYNLNMILDEVRSGTFRLDYPLQRNAMQFSNSQRDGLIASVVKHEFVNAVIACEITSGEYPETYIIDGKNRLTTIDAFRHDGFRTGSQIEIPIVRYKTAKKDKNGVVIIDVDGKIEYETKEFDLRRKRYSDFPQEIKNRFDSFAIDIVKHMDCTKEEVAYHIERYNMHNAMNANQRTIMLMDSEIARKVKQLANHKFFSDISKYSATQVKKNAIDRVITESIMLISHFDGWNKNQKKLAKYMSDNVSVDDFKYMGEILDAICEIVPEKEHTDKFNVTNSFLWFAMFNKFKKYNLETKKFLEFLNVFDDMKDKSIDGITYNEIIENSRATKDKKVIAMKMLHIESLMDEFFCWDDDSEEEYIEEENEYTENMNDTDDVEETNIVMEESNVETDEKHEEIEFSDDYVQEFVERVTGEISLSKEQINEYKQDLFAYADLAYKEDKDIEKHIPSLIAFIAYAYEKDVDVLDEWLVGSIKDEIDTYIDDQEENYRMLVDQLDQYLKLKEMFHKD